jgi:hypothetical protein
MAAVFSAWRVMQLVFSLFYLMKKLFRSAFVLALLGAASVSFAAAPVDVTVSDASGRLAYKGRVNAGGTFATGKLQPGEYVVQFNSGNLPKDDYALVISAGKQKVVADAVGAEKFAAGGVAMKINVGNDLNITGQLTSARAGAVGAKGGKVRMINGKRYVWVTSSTGSNLGGRWVEEGSARAENVIKLDENAVRKFQEGAPSGFSGR